MVQFLHSNMYTVSTNIDQPWLDNGRPILYGGNIGSNKRQQFLDDKKNPNYPIKLTQKSCHF